MIIVDYELASLPQTSKEAKIQVSNYRVTELYATRTRQCLGSLLFHF